MDNRLEIKSYIGVGPIALGMTAEEVRSTLGCPYTEFKRTQSSKTTTDAFISLGIFVYYTVGRKCNAIELARPARAFYAGRELLNNSFDKVYEFIRGFDPAVSLDEDGFTSFGLGIGLYAPGCRDDRLSPAEGVIVFERGYYENDEE